MFLGGASPGWPRPFGDAVLDGVDLDIEGGSATGYAAFVTAMRGLYTGAGSNPGGRAFLITGAPQCPFPVRQGRRVTGWRWGRGRPWVRGRDGGLRGRGRWAAPGSTRGT